MSATKPTTLDQKLGQNINALAQFTENQVKEAEGRIVSALKDAVGEAKAEIIKAAGYPERKIDGWLVSLAHRKYTPLWVLLILGFAVVAGAALQACLDIGG